MDITSVKARRDVMVLLYLAAKEVFYKDERHLHQLEGAIAALEVIIEENEK